MAKREMYQGARITGGVHIQKYYQPDGSEVFRHPNIRGYVKRDANNKVIEQGTRDANLDRGLSLAPPEHPKPHCNGCGQWHDTQEEIDACIAQSIPRDSRAVAIERGQKMRGEKKNTEVDDLRDRVTELTALVEKLVKERD